MRVGQGQFKCREGCLGLVLGLVQSLDTNFISKSFPKCDIFCNHVTLQSNSIRGVNSDPWSRPNLKDPFVVVDKLSSLIGNVAKYYKDQFLCLMWNSCYGVGHLTSNLPMLIVSIPVWYSLIGQAPSYFIDPCSPSLSVQITHFLCSANRCLLHVPFARTYTGKNSLLCGWPFDLEQFPIGPQVASQNLLSGFLQQLQTAFFSCTVVGSASE